MTDEKETCFGCKHITSKWWGDGSTQYGCDKYPGLVTGMVGMLDDDEPTRCEEYEHD